MQLGDQARWSGSLWKSRSGRALKNRRMMFQASNGSGSFSRALILDPEATVGDPVAIEQQLSQRPGGTPGRLVGPDLDDVLQPDPFLGFGFFPPLLEITESRGCGILQTKPDSLLEVNPQLASQLASRSMTIWISSSADISRNASSISSGVFVQNRLDLSIRSESRGVSPCDAKMPRGTGDIARRPRRVLATVSLPRLNSDSRDQFADGLPERIFRKQAGDPSPASLATDGRIASNRVRSARGSTSSAGIPGRPGHRPRRPSWPSEQSGSSRPWGSSTSRQALDTCPIVLRSAPLIRR